MIGIVLDSTRADLHLLIACAHEWCRIDHIIEKADRRSLEEIERFADDPSQWLGEIVLVEDGVGIVLVDVPNHLLATQLQEQANDHQLRIVEVVDVGILSDRQAIEPPEDFGHSLPSAPGLWKRHHTHAADDSALSCRAMSTTS